MLDDGITITDIHMAEIIKLYTDCADKVVVVQEKINAAASCFDSYYKGRGNTLFSGAMEPLYEHLRLLETCMRAMSAYVDSALKIMTQLDYDLANKSPNYLNN